MSNELSIKVNIANRLYPLKVANTEQEKLVRDAAKLINERLKGLNEHFSVKDYQDMLSMAALEFATQLLECQLQSKTVEQQTITKFTELSELLESR